MFRIVFVFCLLLSCLWVQAAVGAVVTEGEVSIVDGEIRIGGETAGHLTVTDPTEFESSSLVVAPFPAGGAQSIATLDGGSWTSTGLSVIGQQGHGELTVNNGGVFTQTGGDIWLGQVEHSEGVINVTGDGSLLRFERAQSQDRIDLEIGGSGSINLSEGGRLESGDGFVDIHGHFEDEFRIAIDGAGSEWLHPGSISTNTEQGVLFEVSDAGKALLGELRIYGFSISRASQPNRIHVVGSDSSLVVGALSDGHNSRSEILVSDGAELVTGSWKPTSWGFEPNGYARIVVAGESSSWTSIGTTYLGKRGRAEVQVSNGATLLGDTIRVGVSHGSGLVEVIGAGSELRVRGDLTVGRYGSDRSAINSSKLIVAAGGLAFLSMHGVTEIYGDGILEVDDGRVTGGTSIKNQGTIAGSGEISAFITNSAYGRVSIGQGQRLEATAISNNEDSSIDVSGGELQVQTLRNNSGTLSVNNGRLTTAPLTGANFRSGGGLLNFAETRFIGGDSHVYGPVLNRETGTMLVTGRSAATFHDSVENHGAISVSHGSSLWLLDEYTGGGIAGSGEVFLEGGVKPAQTGEAMQFGGGLYLGGLSDLQLAVDGNHFDHLTARGQLWLDGELSLAIDNPLPNVGLHTLPILAADAIHGVFRLTPEIGTMLGPTTQLLSIDYGEGEVTLSLFEHMPGDFDRSGSVDTGDYELWKATLGSQALLAADGDGSGTVDLADYTLWRAHLGETMPAGSAFHLTTSVPERGTMVLLSLIVVGGAVIVKYPGAAAISVRA